MAVLAGGGSRASWFAGDEGRSSPLVRSGWWRVIVHRQWAAVVVGSGCERLVMVVGGGGVVLWFLWPSAFVGCRCLSLSAVVVVPCCSSFVATRPLFLICEKGEGGTCYSPRRYRIRYWLRCRQRRRGSCFSCE